MVHVSTIELKCYIWAGKHTIYRYPSFISLSVNDRIKRINDLQLCKICLRSHPNIKVSHVGVLNVRAHIIICCILQKQI